MHKHNIKKYTCSLHSAQLGGLRCKIELLVESCVRKWIELKNLNLVNILKIGCDRKRKQIELMKLSNWGRVNFMPTIILRSGLTTSWLKCHLTNRPYKRNSVRRTIDSNIVSKEPTQLVRPLKAIPHLKKLSFHLVFVHQFKWRPVHQTKLTKCWKWFK